MKALRFDRFGDAGAVLHVEEIPIPVAGPDEVLVQVRAASINPSDVKNVQGKFAQTTLPRTPGRDLAGIVKGGAPEMMGREVWATGGDIGFTRDGSHAEYIVIPQRAAVQKPPPLSMVEAASVGTNYITAFLGLVEKARLREGETVLVTGAGGGVGSSVVKVAKTRGARVIGVDRAAPKAASGRGPDVDLGLSSESDDVVARAEEFTEGRGVDVVFDCVGGPLFETGLRTLGLYGRQVTITVTGDRRVSFDLLDFYRRQLTLFGLNTALLDTVACGAILDRLRPSFEEGGLTPPRISRACSIEDAVEAYGQVDKGTAGGKIVITFAG
ncbi:MAG: zinc-binding alcohol dehydrogenase family protein [Syntrophorhabdales bacterium]|jgi:NADPH:quinone reductase-like Zn-dependent oxidoreductase